MAIPSSSARSCRCSFQVLDRLLLLPPESAQIRILFTPCLHLLPASFHHRRMLSTANSAVSCVTPTLTTARSSPISYVRYGIAFPSAMDGKSCSFTRYGLPLGRHVRPPFFKGPTNSFFFASTDSTRSPLLRNDATCPVGWRKTLVPARARG